MGRRSSADIIIPIQQQTTPYTDGKKIRQNDIYRLACILCVCILLCKLHQEDYPKTLGSDSLVHELHLWYLPTGAMIATGEKRTEEKKILCDTHTYSFSLETGYIHQNYENFQFPENDFTSPLSSSLPLMEVTKNTIRELFQN